jgi:hypothetical protein
MRHNQRNTDAQVARWILPMTLALLVAGNITAQRRQPSRPESGQSQGQGDVFSSDSRNALPPFRLKASSTGPRVYRHGSSALLHCQGQQGLARQKLENWYSDTLALIAEDSRVAREHFENDMKTWRGKNQDIRKAGEKRLRLRMERNRQWEEDTRALRECYKEWISEDCWGNPDGVYWTQRCDEYVERRVVPQPDDRTPREPKRDPLGFPSADAAPPPKPAPTIIYEPQCDRQLLFVNNPEKILSKYLTDKKGDEHRLIYQEIVTKPSRLFFEHLNWSGGSINYGVQLVNNTNKAVQITIEGSGFATGYAGGEPFRTLFTSRRLEVIRIEPGKTFWLMRTPSPLAHNTFFSGVVDFRVQGGSVVLKAYIYRDLSELDKPVVFHGNLTDHPDNYKVYNGIVKCTELLAKGVNFTIDDKTSGALNVQYQSREGFKANASEWYTHSLGHNLAIKGDMFDIIKPGGEVIYAEGWKWKGKQLKPNWGNWGVVYRLRGEITNTGKRNRCVSIKLRLNSPKGIALAWRDEKGLWRQEILNNFNNKEGKSYYRLLVPAGSKVPYEASFVLGGPSNSYLRNWVSVGDADQCR